MHAAANLAVLRGSPVVQPERPGGQQRLAWPATAGPELEHQSPNARTLYGHLSELSSKKGKWLEQGTVDWAAGSTVLSTGPAICTSALRQPEIRSWVAVDPGRTWDPRPGILAQCSAAIRFG